jgi:hypothetical protein
MIRNKWYKYKLFYVNRKDEKRNIRFSSSMEDNPMQRVLEEGETYDGSSSAVEIST